MTRFVLASASPARRALLIAAGIDPTVHVSRVDEDALAAELGPVSPADVVAALARAKAHDVAAEHPQDDAVVVGCDSMLHLVAADGTGVLVGKPHTVAIARERWAVMAGRTGELLTGHCVLRVVDGTVTAEATGTSVTTVRFGTPGVVELEAYLATGEPLEVAGAFTLDGLGGWFVEGIDGDPSSVVGLGLPLVRRLLREVGISVTELWRPT